MFTGGVSGTAARPKVNMDLHSVPNGTTFELGGRKWVKTTSNMMKTGKPILTTADGKFQIIQHGDTFKINRLADSRTGYVNIGEARSLPQAEKMVGDAAAAKGTGTAGTVGGKGTKGMDGSAGKADIHTASRAGKTGEGAATGKGIETRGNGFRKGLIGEGGRRAKSASDGFTEGLLGKEGKAGGDGKYLHEFSDDPVIRKGKEGGAYGELKTDGYERHHMPSDSESPFSTNEGPALRMESNDHKLTRSWGRSKDAFEYRRKQGELLRQGKFLEAQQMDVDDVHELFGNKYDDGIREMIEYTRELLKKKGMGGIR